MVLTTGKNYFLIVAEKRQSGRDGDRIIQRKMSMKDGNREGRFLMQDEHETGKNGVGVARPGADTDAECRGPEPGPNPRVSTQQRADRVRRQRAGRTIPEIGRASCRE